MAVHRPDVLQPEILEHPLRRQRVLDALLHRVQRVVGDGAEAGLAVEPLLDGVQRRLVARIGADVGELVGQAADGRRVGPSVVVDDDDDPTVARRDVVERLPGHAAGHRAVADDRDDRGVDAAQLVGLGHTVGVRKTRRRVRVLHPVVLGLGLARVPGKPVGLPEPFELRGPSGEHLVHVRLMPGVPHDPVTRRLEDAMERHRQLDHAEVRPEVPAVPRDGIDQPGADLPRQIVELLVGEVAEILRTGQRIEQCHLPSLEAAAFSKPSAEPFILGRCAFSWSTTKCGWPTASAAGLRPKVVRST